MAWMVLGDDQTLREVDYKGCPSGGAGGAGAGTICIWLQVPQPNVDKEDASLHGPRFNNLRQQVAGPAHWLWEGAQQVQQ